jgi:hypothetical protein
MNQRPTSQGGTTTRIVHANQTSNHLKKITSRDLTDPPYSSLEGGNLTSSGQVCSGSDPKSTSLNNKMYSKYSRTMDEEDMDEEDLRPPQTFVAVKSRQRRKKDALGGSLHTSTISSGDDSLGSFDSLDTLSSHGTKSSPVLGVRKKELLLRKRGGSGRHGPIPSFDVPFASSSPPLPPSTSVKEKESSRSHHQLRSSLYQEDQHHDPWYKFPSRKRVSLSRKKRWFLACQLAMFALFVGAAVFYANHHISRAQHKLKESQTETSHILSQMESMEKRAKENIAGVDNRQHTPSIQDSTTGSASDSSKVQALMDSVQALEASLQQTSKARLEEAFPSSVLRSHIEVALYLEGIPNPLVIEVPYAQVPYTTWTWLNQIRHDRWDHSTFRRVSHSLEIAPDSPVEEVAPESPIEMAPDGGPGVVTEGDSKLQFHEKSIPIDDAFVVGMKNSEMGLILTIHLDHYGCGNHDDEVCFGKMVDGFDSLDLAQTSHKYFTIGSVKIL